MDPVTRNAFLSDLGAAQHAVRFGVTSSRASATNSHWKIWAHFYSELALDPFLQDVPDPVVFLQTFLERYRSGKIAPKRRPVRARTAEDALRSIRQTFTAMGAPDPRLTATGDVDFRLARQLRFYSKDDPPPARVKPIPVAVLHWITNAASLSQNCSSHAVSDMAALAFFFLLRPGEYTSSTTDSRPFRLADLRLAIGSLYLDLSTAPDASLDAATFLSLTFTTQKNGVRGEVIGLGRSGSPTLCPVLAAVRRVKHLRAHGAPPHTPIASYFDRTWRQVTPADITAVLQTAVLALGTLTLGFLPSEVSARSLRAAGAMTLL